MLYGTIYVFSDPKHQLSYLSARTPVPQTSFSSSSSSRYTSTLDQIPTVTDSNSAERLNQIRSRLSLGNYDKFSNLDRNRPVSGAGGEFCV